MLVYEIPFFFIVFFSSAMQFFFPESWHARPSYNQTLPGYMLTVIFFGIHCTCKNKYCLFYTFADRKGLTLRVSVYEHVVL